ncbi:MAG: hypothetical protein U9R36_04940 [Elusimicrobiota bacterium]|nr:hypothetical protein [Elusimicrobiota bacterium]
MLNKSKLKEALSLLAGKMELHGFRPYEILVCGGAALIMNGFIKGVTKDVDAIGVVERSGTGEFKIKEFREIPADLMVLIKEISEDLKLPGNWLNTEASGLVRYGLPEGFMERAVTETFGKCLQVHFAGRLDLIYFKLYAAADSGPGRHTEDLMILSPSKREIEEASKWALTHDTSPGFREILKDMLRKLGYGKIAERI